MVCQHCESKRVLEVQAKCSDLFFCELPYVGAEHEGYVPSDLHIGGGDYIDFKMCLDCGQVQGNFPLSVTELEGGTENDNGVNQFEDEDDD